MACLLEEWHNVKVLQLRKTHLSTYILSKLNLKEIVLQEIIKRYRYMLALSCSINHEIVRFLLI